MENSDGTTMEQSIEADIARENELNSKLGIKLFRIYSNIDKIIIILELR